MADYVVQEESLESVADSIRAKAGISEKLEFPVGWKAAVDGIKGESAPDGSSVTFGYETETVTTEVPTGKAYHNGVLLPELPEDALAQYPYAWIQKDTNGGNYNLLLAPVKWYFANSVIDADCNSGGWYRLPISGAGDAAEWTRYASIASGNYFLVDSDYRVLWSSHDIPNGSATATSIYFAGSNPVPEVVEETQTTTAPADRDGQYAITGADLNELGAVTQKMAGNRALMTVSDMIYWLNRVQFIPQGNAESVIDVSPLFITSAYGALQEG